MPLATAKFLQDASDGKITIETDSPAGDVEIDIKEDVLGKLWNDIWKTIKVVT